ncbi:MAG: thioesterase family protein [Solirubrobacteraceae bacterium]
METVFDRDTAVSREADGVFAATIAPGWRAGRGPHGGYLAAMLLRALIATVDDPERTPRSLTIHYTRAPEPGPIEILVTIARAGRSLSTLSARMQQDGKLTALALAAFSVPWRSPKADELPMPELAPPDAERCSTPKLFKGAPEFTRHIVMQPRVGAVPFAGSGAPMRIGGWTGLPDPERPVDAPALALFCDAWFPPSFIALDSPAISPTVDLTIHFRRSIEDCDCDPAALCLGVFDTRLLHDGLFEEDGVIWAPDGSVLAQSRQLGIIMPTDKPVLQPATLGSDQSAA